MIDVKLFCDVGTASNRTASNARLEMATKLRISRISRLPPCLLASDRPNRNGRTKHSAQPSDRPSSTMLSEAWSYCAPIATWCLVGPRRVLRRQPRRRSAQRAGLVRARDLWRPGFWTGRGRSAIVWACGGLFRVISDSRLCDVCCDYSRVTWQSCQRVQVRLESASPK